MTKILFICQQEGLQKQKEVLRDLCQEGYEVEQIGLESLDLSSPEVPEAELAIVHLHPDVPATWGTYLDLKHRFPDFPVLVYMRHHAVDTLKSAIKNIFAKKAGAA